MDITQISTADNAHAAALAGDAPLTAACVLAHPGSLIVDAATADLLSVVKLRPGPDASAEKWLILGMAFFVLRKVELAVGRAGGGT
jgi:hypothetical protein